MPYKIHIKIVKPNWNLDKLIFKKKELLKKIIYTVTESIIGESIIIHIYNEKSPIKNSLPFAPKTLYHFDKGRIEECLPGKTLRYHDLNGIIIAKIARELRKLHDTNLNHNDLNLKNIMIINDEIQFINFDFMNQVDAAYDIANFFIEWMFDYDSKEWYLPNKNLLPSRRQLVYFCEKYLKTTNQLEISKLIQDIYACIPRVHAYWGKWANSTALYYQLFISYRLQLKDINHQQYIEKKIIYCDGVFDLLHVGHLSLFQKIRNLNCKQLIVGVIADKDAESYKRTPILNCKLRSTMVKSLDVVDQVVSECPFNSLTNEFLDYYGIDLVVYGGDPKSADPLGTWKQHYQAAIDRDALMLLGYTAGVSTSEIIKKCQLS